MRKIAYYYTNDSKNPPSQCKMLACVCDKELEHSYLILSSVKDSYIFSIKSKGKTNIPCKRSKQGRIAYPCP